MDYKKMIGFLLIMLGILLVLSNAGVVEFDLRETISLYWPILLIFAGLFNIITNPTAKKGGVIILLAGIFFQLRKLEQFEFLEYLSFWPIVVIFCGIWFIFSDRDETKSLAKDSFDSINIFSGADNKLVTDNFKGGSSIVVFGGVEIDLSQAEIKEEKAQIDLFIAFGGADITVPKDWNVIVKGLPIFGGWDNHTSANKSPEAPTLVVNSVLLFAGCDIKEKN